MRYAVMSVGIIAVVCGAVVLAVACRPRKNLLPRGAEYAKKRTMLTAPEVDFLFMLRNIVDPRRYEILPQTSLNAVIDKTNAAYRNELFRLIDFCIADGATFEPLLLIELNDASHNREDRKLRDEKVRAICAAARLPLVSFTFAEATDIRIIRDKIRKHIR